MFTHRPWLFFKSPSTCLVKPLSTHMGVWLGSWGCPRATQDKPRALPFAAVLGSIFNIYPSFSREKPRELWEWEGQRTCVCGGEDSLWIRRVRDSWLPPLSWPTHLLASQECHERFCKEKKKGFPSLPWDHFGIHFFPGLSRKLTWRCLLLFG